MKKFKILVGVGLIAALLTGALALYAGVAAVRHLAKLGNDLPVAQHAQALKSTVESLPNIAKTECLGTAQGLLNLDKLLSTPLKESLQNLSQACLGETPHHESEII